MARLPPRAEIDWSNPASPRSAAFDDVYFAREGGLDEADSVFLQGCGLPEAWEGRSRFSICELGFGTGLNALAVWRAWKRARKPHAILHMCSVEAFPLEGHDAARALAHFPKVEPLAEKLLARWPVRAYAPQRLWFPEDGFALTLHVGDAAVVLDGLSGQFDAWFFDGFAPARNPAMWAEGNFRRIAALSAPGARLATFTVAGAVRRGLEAAGFAVEKKPGFGAKRERLEGRLAPTFSLAEKVAAERPDEGRSDSPAPAKHPSPPTPSVRSALGVSKSAGPQAARWPQGRGGFELYPYAPCYPNRVAIIGAGIAGAATAAALLRRGVETVLLDAAPALGAGASGNPAGLVIPRLDRDGPLREVFLAAYLEAVRAYEALGVFDACGVEERAGAREAAVLADLIADPPLPEDWLRRLEDSVALHPRAGVVRPLAAIEAMARGAHMMLDAPVSAFERVEEGWRVLAPDGKPRLKVDAIVLACGAALRAFEPAQFLPLHFSRGQIEWGPLNGAAPTRALSAGNYCAPYGGDLVFGATFDRWYGPPAPSPAGADAGEAPAVHGDEESRARNLGALTQLAPDFAARLNQDALQSRAALRVATPDHAPIAGLMPDAPAWLAQNEGIAHGRAPDTSLPAPALPGVYVLGALGARGLMLAPLLGERIAAEMFGEPQTLSLTALSAIHPARFLHRALKKRVTTQDEAGEDGL